MTVVMNAEFIGDWDVAPRGHPNDGRVEVLQADPSDVGCASASRYVADSAAGPTFRTRSIATRTVKERIVRVRTARWSLLVDGVSVGRCRRLSVRVRPDAVIVYV